MERSADTTLGEEHSITNNRISGIMCPNSPVNFSGTYKAPMSFSCQNCNWNLISRKQLHKTSLRNSLLDYWLELFTKLNVLKENK